MGDPTKDGRQVRCAIGFGIIAAIAIGVIVYLRPWQSASRGTSGDVVSFPLPPLSETHFLNSGPDATYVGINACAECHRGNHQSFLLTAHSRALADLDPNAEPPDGSFAHSASGHSFRVYRQGNQFRHEEILRSADGKEIARADFPIRYVIGSGSFCRSYLVDVDGFLHESPITWYTSRKRWDMSPGYDFAGQWSFERPVKMGCLKCHVGRAEPDTAGTDRVSIREQAIGCESCHGPGSKHVAYHRANKQPPGAEDLTIVNPQRLSRSRLEAVCAACHLSGVATVAVRGRAGTDFRPGSSLADYLIDYRFDSGGERMTVVGHIEQLRRSACYQKSTDMTCLTCHDPHAKEKPKDPVEYYRSKCLSCHETHGCSVPLAERKKKEPADNCSACHMPRGDTEIPHVAFTHHRIGRHPAPPATDPSRLPELVPIDDVSHLSTLDQKRNLGLAYLHVATTAEHAHAGESYLARARELLQGVHQAKMRDGAVAEALARINWLERDYETARTFAQEALAASDLSPDGRDTAATILADCQIRDFKFEAAVEILEGLTKRRRHAEDWRLLGHCYLQLGQTRQAVRALEQAAAIQPFRAHIHGALGDAYLQAGDQQRGHTHLDKAQVLSGQR